MPNDQATAPVCDLDPQGHCSICADEGVVGEVLSVDEDGTARVMVVGEDRVVALDLLDGVRAGESILIHLGFAIARVEGA